MKKESALMKNMILSYKLNNDLLTVVDNLFLQKISTSSAKKILSNFNKNLSILFLSKNQPSHNSLISVRNLPFVKYSTLNMVTCKDLIKYENIIVDESIFSSDLLQDSK